MRPITRSGPTIRRRRGGLAPRLQTAAGLAVAAVLTLAGCSGASGHSVGDAVVTKLHDSAFTGTVSIRTTKVERVTPAAMRSFGLTTGGDTGYVAWATIKVDSGSFPAASVGDFGNAAWGLVADNALQAGPKLEQAQRSAALQRVCPFRAVEIAAALRNGRSAEVCAVLLAPRSSAVTAVTYLRAKSTDSSVSSPSTITWKASA